MSTILTARTFTSDGTTQTGQAKAAALTALGVLVPAEVIAASTVASGALAAKTDAGTSDWLHLGLARVLVLLLGLVGIPLLFRIGSGGWWRNGWRGVALLGLTMASFAGWLAVQPLSIYQGWFVLDAGQVAAIGLVGALILGGLAGALGWSQGASD